MRQDLRRKTCGKH